MKILFMGTPDFAVGTLEAVVKAGHEIVSVVTQPDKPKGRGKAVQETPVKACAGKYGIPVYQPVKVRTEESVEYLKQLGADVVVVVAFGQILPKSILEMTPYGCLNVHASLLPKYRGAAPIQWAILDGEKETGVTIMQMNEGLDEGDMLAAAVCPIEEKETGGSLFEKLESLGAELLTDTLRKLEAGELHPKPQPAESPTAYARMITKKDGSIDWTRSAAEIERLIRGMDPWPGTYTGCCGKTLKIWAASVEEEDTAGDAGTVLYAGKEGMLVQTGKGTLRILELQPEGKRRMEAAAYLRGSGIPAGTILKAKE